MIKGHLDIFISIFKYIKASCKIRFKFLIFLLDVEYDHGSETNIKLKMGQLNLSKKKKTKSG